MFKRIIIWGHPLHMHTHSYIHEGFARAFKHLGYEVWWMPNQPMFPEVDLAGALIITEGQVDSYLPRHPEATYVLHNCDFETYKQVRHRCLGLQVCIGSFEQGEGRAEPWKELAPFTFWRPVDGCLGELQQPWATDLMPDQFDFADAEKVRKDCCYWVGTIGGGQFGNENEINPFKAASEESGIEFIHRAGVDSKLHKSLVQASYISPAIVGTWQLEHGYVPCRIFKNISYGHMGVTNSPTVQRLFGGTLVQNTDTHALFHEAKEVVHGHSGVERTRALMEKVRDEHTYLNRISRILELVT